MAIFMQRIGRFVSVGLLASSLFHSAHAQPSQPSQPSRHAGKRIPLERVVAVVNTTIIMQSELESRLLPLVQEAQNIANEQERKRRIEQLTTQMLDDMIAEQLVIEAANAANLDVESADIDAAIADIKSQNNLDDAGLTQALAQQGYTMSGYRQELRKQILRMRAVNQMVRPKVNVSDEDVQTRMAELRKQSAGTQAVRVAHILFKLPAKPTETDVTAARTKATAALERVRGGEPFAKVAGEVSDDAATKSSGGELGWFERGSMSVPEWETVLFAMAKDEVRGPISGPEGLYLFRVVDVKAGAVEDNDATKEQIRGELLRKHMDRQTTLWLEDLRKKAYIDIKLTPRAPAKQP